MNKKLFFSMAAASLLMVTSCSQDDFGGSVKPEGSEANVEFNLTLPVGIQSRDYSDGTSATTLQYALYEKDANGDLTLFPATKESIDNAFTDLKRKVSFKLVTGHTYGVVFFAANPAAPYTVDFATDGATLTVDYTGIKANDETLDAFYAYTDFAVTGDVQMEVKLYRPFAQINVGTSDYSDAAELGFEPKVSNMTVSNVYSTLDLVTGDVSDPQKDVAYAYNAIGTTESFPVIGYEYLDMVYALVDKTKALVDVTFAYATDATGAGEKTRTVTNVPVQRNYRTNIYGQVLTSNVDLYVEIIPDYNEPDYEVNPLYVAAGVGGTVVLENNMDVDSIVIVRNDMVVDLNGYNLSFTNPSNFGFQVQQGATLTIQGEGTIATEDDAPVCVNGGTLIVKSGTIDASKNHSEAIYISNNGGKVYIEGGYFKGQAYEGRYYVLNCHDKAYTDGIAKFYVSGGTFENFNPAASQAEPTVADWVVEGFKSEEIELNGVTCYTVVPAEIDVVAATIAEAAAAAKEGQNVQLFNDIQMTQDEYTGGVYGSNWAAIVQNGGVIDGNDNTLNGMMFTINGKETYGVYTSGGTIKNLNILNFFRSIYIAEKVYDDVHVENCVVRGGYTLNTAGSNYDYNLYVKDTKFHGWTTWSAFVEAEFTNCEFIIGTTWSQPEYNNLCRPYIKTLFKDCKFPANWNLSIAYLRAGEYVTFDNCYVNGQLLTADNIQDLFGTIEIKDTQDINDLVKFK